MMTTNKIKRFNDLFIEEIKIKRRLNKQEAQLKSMMLSLPDDIADSAINKFIPGKGTKLEPENFTISIAKLVLDKILESNFFKSIIATLINTYLKKS